MLSLGINYFRFPIAYFQFVCATSHLVFPIGNRQLEIGNDAIRLLPKPCPRPPFGHLRESRTANPSPLQSARSARCPSSRCRPASPSLLPAAGVPPQSRPSSESENAAGSQWKMASAALLFPLLTHTPPACTLLEARTDTASVPACR